MNFVEIKENDLVYKAEYIVIDNLLTVFGKNSRSEIQLNGMTEGLAARTGLKNLIRINDIDPE